MARVLCPANVPTTGTHGTPSISIHLKLCESVRTSRPRFNIKMSSYQYRKSHCGDKTVVRSSYLHNGISYTGKMTSLYWFSPRVACLSLFHCSWMSEHRTCICIGTTDCKGCSVFISWGILINQNIDLFEVIWSFILVSAVFFFTIFILWFSKTANNWRTEKHLFGAW